MQQEETTNYQQQAKVGTECGDLIAKDLMLKCRCYKNYDLYLDFVRTTDGHKFRHISNMALVKEALQLIKHDEITGGVILDKFTHPNEEDSIIMRVLTYDGSIAAASITTTILKQYTLEQQKKLSSRCSLNN